MSRRTGVDFCRNGLVEVEERIVGGGVQGCDDGRAREYVCVCDVCPCCYGERTAGVLGLDGACRFD